MSLDLVLGQDRAVRRLKGLLKSGRIPGALLLQGPEGVGKKKAAMAFAAALICPEGGCGVCRDCEFTARGVHPDARLVDAQYQALLNEEDLEEEAEKSLDKQQQWRIDTIREICGDMQKRSFSGNWKTAVIDDAERMNLDAQNALLKMLEEPPPRSLWILVSAQPGKLLPTVLSRSQRVAFSPLPDAVLRTLLLREGLSEEEAAAFAGSGSVGAALRTRQAREEFGGLQGPLAPVEAAKRLPRDLASARKKAARALELLASDLRARLASEPGRALDGLQDLERLRKMLRQNVSPSMIVALAFFKMEKHG